MRALRLLLVAFTFAVAVACTRAQWTVLERKMLSEALTVGGLKEADLASLLEDASASGLPQRLLVARPMEGFDELLRFQQKPVTSLSGLLRSNLEFGFGDRIAPPAARAAIAPNWPADVPAAIRAPLAQLLDAVAEAQSEVRGCLKRVLPDERRTLIEGLPLSVAGAENVKFDFVKQTQFSPARLEQAILKVNGQGIRLAAATLTARLTAPIAALQRAASTTQWRGQVRLVIGDVNVEVGGIGPNRYERRDTHLCVDLGGDDSYTGRYGAGVGYTAILIDLGGNDRLSGPDLNLGAAVLGIGFVVNLGGDDTVKAGSLSLGSGLLGVGAYWKEGGRDTIEARSMALGFGSRGVGLYVDTGGDDRIQAVSRGLGSGQESGLGGYWDGSGDDIVRLIGGESSAVLAGVRFSRSLGFGERSGIGLCIDSAGNDVTTAQSLAFAAAATGGLGAYADFAGDDVRRAGGLALAYSQGAFSLLFEREGDDQNLLTASSGLGWVQGAGMAAFVDREGDDAYLAGGPAVARASNGGIALVLDSAGHDAYTALPGVASGDRLSLAIFVDAAEPDTYADGFGNDEALVTGSLGLALDRSLVPPTEQEIPDVPLPAVKSLSPAEISQRWTEFKNPTAGRGAALSRLLEGGPAALGYGLDRPEADFDFEGCTTLARLLGPSAAPAIVERLKTPQAGRALRVAAAGKVALQSEIRAPLADPQLQRAALSLAMEVPHPEAFTEIVVLARGQDEAKVRMALAALLRLGRAEAAPEGVAYLARPDIRLRSLAEQVVALDPNSAVSLLRAQLARATGEDLVRWLAFAAKVTHPAVGELVAPSLKSSESPVRLAALRALQGRVPASARPDLIRLQTDPDPLVRSLALRLDPGR